MATKLRKEKKLKQTCQEIVWEPVNITAFIERHHKCGKSFLWFGMTLNNLILWIRFIQDIFKWIFIRNSKLDFYFVLKLYTGTMYVSGDSF